MRVGQPFPPDVNPAHIEELNITGELRSHRNRNNLGRKSNLDVLSCAWSSCGGHLAWISGPRTVSLVPFEQGQIRTQNAVDMECGEEVWSLCLGETAPCLDNTVSFACWRYQGASHLLLVTGLSKGRIRVWSLRTGQLYMELMDHQLPVVDVALTPSESPVGRQLASASQDGTVKFWDLEDGGNMYHTLGAGRRAGPNNNGAYCVSWAPDGTTLASAGTDMVVSLSRVGPGQGCRRSVSAVRRLTHPRHCVSGVAFSPDGSLVAAASHDTGVHVWFVKCGTKIFTLGHLFPSPSTIYAGGVNGAHVTGLAFSSDGRHIATVCEDSYVRVWDTEHPSCPVQVHNTDLLKPLVCAYSPDGRTLAVGTEQGTVLLLATTRELCSLHYLARLAIVANTSQQDVDKLPLPAATRHYLCTHN